MSVIILLTRTSKAIQIMKMQALAVIFTAFFLCKTDAGESHAPSLLAHGIDVRLPSADLAQSYRATLLEKVKSFGNLAENDAPYVVQAVLYIHPLYLDQALVRSITDNGQGVSENGSAFAVDRARAFIEDINLTLLNSGINAVVEIKFLTVLPNDFPMTGSTGFGQLTTPDGLTTTTTDAGYFDLLVQDWAGATSKYGFSASHSVRQIRDTSKADLHIFLRPFIDENVIPPSGLTNALSSYQIDRPLIDSQVGFAFDMSSMAIYDPYWFIGSQGFNPLAGYGLRTAAHQFGHVLRAGHEQGQSTSPYSYGKAYACGGVNTVMYSTITPISYPIYSSPTNFVNGEPCGVAIGSPGESNNSEVVRQSLPLLAAVEEPVTTDVEISISTTSPTLHDEEVTNVDIFRTGNLSDKTFVTLYGLPGTATEQTDYNFRLQTVEFAKGENKKSVELAIPLRDKNYSAKTLSVVAGFALNGRIAAGMGKVDFSIEPNKTDPLGFSLGEIAEEFDEGTEFNVLVTPNSVIESSRTIQLSVESTNMVEGVNYAISTKSLPFSPGETEGKTVTVKLLNDSKYSNEQYLDLLITEGSSLLASKRITVKEASEPDRGVVVFQNSEVEIDNLTTELSFRLYRTDGLDDTHTVQIQLATNNPTDYSNQVVLPDSVLFAAGETEKTSVLKFTTNKLAEYVFDVYSQTTQSVTDTLRVKVVKAASLPRVNVSSTVRANENSEFAPIIINRSDSRLGLTISVEYVEESAKAGVDFLDNTKLVEMPPGVESVTLQVPVVNILEDSTDRTFKVKFKSDLAQFGVDTASVTVVDIKNSADEDDGKIDNYEAGSFSFWWFLVILPLMFIRRSKEDL